MRGADAAVEGAGEDADADADTTELARGGDDAGACVGTYVDVAQPRAAVSKPGSDIGAAGIALGCRLDCEREWL